MLALQTGCGSMQVAQALQTGYGSVQGVTSASTANRLWVDASGASTAADTRLRWNGFHSVQSLIFDWCGVFLSTRFGFMVRGLRFMVIGLDGSW